ncbi:YfiR family protein [Nitrosomonas sp.]|uniref:YfiR family protein n=1 Tax=Nitrosomonas sp. TaxID=42353 RepID=UPI0025F15654|nr:YfiR family protein [Nitrosomonas sp.]
MLNWMLEKQEETVFYGSRRIRKRSFIRYFPILSLCWFLFLGYSPLTQAEQPSEYRLKVAFLYNFSAYTEWPSLPDQVLNFCIYGEDPFGENLQHLQHKKAHEHEIVVRHTRNSEDLPSCQIVFITRSSIDNLSDVIKQLDGMPILTIADTPGASQQGVILNMTMKEGKVTFEANVTIAKKKPLKTQLSTTPFRH